MAVALETLPNVTPLEPITYTWYERAPEDPANPPRFPADIRWQFITEPDTPVCQPNVPPQTLQRLGKLVTKFQALLIPSSIADPNAASRSACPIDRTNVTDLFADKYGVDATVFQTPKSNKTYRLFATVRYPHPPDFVKVGYQVSYKGYSLPFWELYLTPGGVSMVCLRDNDKNEHREALPLTGNGTVTRLPGLLKALFADAEILEKAPREQRG